MLWPYLFPLKPRAGSTSRAKQRGFAVSAGFSSGPGCFPSPAEGEQALPLQGLLRDSRVRTEQILSSQNELREGDPWNAQREQPEQRLMPLHGEILNSPFARQLHRRGWFYKASRSSWSVPIFLLILESSSRPQTLPVLSAHANLLSSPQFRQFPALSAGAGAAFSTLNCWRRSLEQLSTGPAHPQPRAGNQTNSRNNKSSSVPCLHLQSCKYDENRTRSAFTGCCAQQGDKCFNIKH